MTMLRTSKKAIQIAEKTIPGFFTNQSSSLKKRRRRTPLNDEVELKMTYINDNPIPKNF